MVQYSSEIIFAAVIIFSAVYGFSRLTATLTIQDMSLSIFKGESQMGRPIGKALVLNKIIDVTSAMSTKRGS